MTFVPPVIDVYDHGVRLDRTRIPLSPALCRAMAVLARLMPGVATHETLRLALRSGYRTAHPRSGPARASKVVHVQMHALRKALAPTGLVVECVWGHGYALRWDGNEVTGAPPQ